MCPFAYYISYELKIKRISKNMILGNIVHSILEKFCEISSDELDQSFKSDMPYKYNLIDVLWKKELLLLNDYELLEIKNEDIDNYKRMIFEVLNRRGIEFFTNPHIKREYRFDFTLSNGVPINGIFDVVDIQEDMLEIIDWKTSKNIPKYDDLYSDPQLRMYDLAARYEFGDKYKRLITIDFLRRGPMTCSFSDRQIKETEQYLMQEYVKILECKKPERKKGWRCKAMCMGLDECNRYWEEIFNEHQ